MWIINNTERNSSYFEEFGGLANFYVISLSRGLLYGRRRFAFVFFSRTYGNENIVNKRDIFTNLAGTLGGTRYRGTPTFNNIKCDGTKIGRRGTNLTKIEGIFGLGFWEYHGGYHLFNFSTYLILT